MYTCLILDKDIKSVEVVINAIILDLEIPFEKSNSEACLDSSSNLTCPLKSEVSVNYYTELSILPMYPTVNFIFSFNFFYLLHKILFF